MGNMGCIPKHTTAVQLCAPRRGRSDNEDDYADAMGQTISTNPLQPLVNSLVHLQRSVGINLTHDPLGCGFVPSVRAPGSRGAVPSVRRLVQPLKGPK